MTVKGMGKGRRLRGIPNKFIDESDDEKDSEWLEKGKTGKGRRKGKGRGKKLGGVPKDKFDNFIDDEEEKVKTGKGRGKGKGRGRGKKNLVKTPEIDTFFDALDGAPNVPALPVSKVAPSNGTENDNDNSAKTSDTASPTTAMCNRFLLCSSVSSGGGGYTRARTERMEVVDLQRGTCPICSKEMEMSTLEYHAAGCQGSE